MSKVFVVWRDAVYMQGVFAVFTAKSEAIKFADYIATKDIDSHHTYHVSELPFDDMFQVDHLQSVFMEEGHILNAREYPQKIYSVTKGDAETKIKGEPI